MTEWAKRNPLPLFFLVTTAVGLMLISAAAFTQGWFAGLLTSGACVLGAGHWITYLRTLNGGRA